MKRGLLYMVLMLLMGARIAAHAQELTVSDVQNSGCMRDREYGRRRANAEGEPTRTIILTKEGDALHVQLLNYVENCGTSGFDVTPSMSGGSDGTPCSVAVSVEPVIFADADCDCPYNVSFTVHGLEANSFLFSCWWCEGMVTLTDGEPLVLEDVWEDVSIEDLGYKIHEVMHSAQLTGGKSWEGELNIPSEVNYEGQKYVVTNIGYNAFVDNTALTSVTIPNTVLSIGSGAFARCTGLTSIVIPEGVKSLGHNVFSGCTNLASITIPNSVIQIGGSVFNGTAWYDNQPDGVIYAGRMAYTYKGTMPEGTQIDIKEGTIAIANNAFCRCDNLTSVTIPGSVSTIGYDAFWRCNNLKTVIISEGVKRIEHAAFSNCTSLKSIVIPESVTHIGEYAFMECTALTSATINGAITRMGRWAFGGCTALYSLSISQNVKDIGNETFSNCTSLYRVKIPGSVTRLGDGLFYRCSNLYSVQIFEGVEAIGYSAFGECNNMSYVILPNSLTKIDDYAFYNCSKLNKVICFADNVPTTGGNVFYNSPIASATLNVPSASVDLYKAVSPWKDFARITPPHVNGWNVSIDGFNYFLYPESHTAELNNKNSRSGELDIPTEVSYKGHTYSVNGMIVNAFSGCTQLTKVRIPKTIDHVVHHVLSEDPNIGGAFSSYYMNPFTGCTALESIEVDEENPIFSSDGGVLFNKDKTRLYGYPAGARQTSYTVPESITWVGDDAFANNQYLTTLTIPNSVTRLGSGVCSGCANLKSVRLPENITLIGAYSFQYCPKLKFLDIPESVQSFGEYVFRSTPFEAIVFRGTFPQGLRNDTFYSMDDSTILYVQRSEINKFKAVFSGQVLPLDSYTPPVSFTAGQVATIILPVNPDASKGKYYRLDRYEEGQIIFEEETHPQARTPYVIVPNEDFNIDLSTLDVDGLRFDTLKTEAASPLNPSRTYEIRFVGTYAKREIGEKDNGFRFYILDTTPDCIYHPEGKSSITMGPLRAHFEVNIAFCYDRETMEYWDELKYVLHDYGTGIASPLVETEEGAIFDLQGRKLQCKPTRGIYIENGKKILIK